MKPDDFNKSPKRVALPACGIVVFEARHAPGFFGELKDDYAKFCLVIAGRALWESGGQQYTVATNTFFHIAAQVPHRQRDLPGQPVTLYTIHYRPELLRPEITRELNAAGTLPLDLKGPGADQVRQILDIVQEMMFEQETQGSRISPCSRCAGTTAAQSGLIASMKAAPEWHFMWRG